MLFSLTAIYSHLALGLFGMHLTAVSKLAETKFSYHLEYIFQMSLYSYHILIVYIIVGKWHP